MRPPHLGASCFHMCGCGGPATWSSGHFGGRRPRVLPLDPLRKCVGPPRRGVRGGAGAGGPDDEAATAEDPTVAHAIAVLTVCAAFDAYAPSRSWGLSLSLSFSTSSFRVPSAPTFWNSSRFVSKRRHCGKNTAAAVASAPRGWPFSLRGATAQRTRHAKAHAV